MNDRYGYDGGDNGPQHYLPPGPPYGYPGYALPVEHRAPSRITAAIAASLAMVAGVIAAAIAVWSLVVVVDVGNDDHSGSSDLPDFGGLIVVIFLALAVVSGFLALLFLLGGVLLFARLTAGRILVIISSTLGVSLSAFGFREELNYFALAPCTFFVTTLVLAAVPSTGRWIAAGKNRP